MKHFLLPLTLLLASCATTDMTSFTDPAFKGYKYTSFVVVTPRLNLEYSDLLQSNICKSIKNTGARCVRSLDMFPPTRAYDGEQIAESLKKNGIDGYLVVAYGGGVSSAQQVGSMSYGSASVYANTITAYSSTVPVTSFSRSDGYSIVLIDTQSVSKAWVGGAKTHAQGLANITDSVFTKSLSKKIADELNEAGLL